MSANLLFLIILAITAVFTLALNSASIKWGLKWAAITEVSLLKAFGVFLAFVVSGALVAMLATVVLFAITRDPSERTLDAIGYAAAFLTPPVLIAIIYKVRPLKAAQASFPYLLVSIAMPLVAIYLIRPYVYEAFAISSNAMAPTLLGQHVVAPCTRCGRPAYGSPVEAQHPLPPEGLLMICSAERLPVYVTPAPSQIAGPDRMLASKLIQPRRWDMIVFRYPADPSYFYVMRLVGLPGEELSIHDGAVWINDEKLNPPESLAGTQYAATIDVNGHVYSGPGSVPVKLGPDEYFVLGDFPDQSADSRLWERGAPGYPPYAVPASYIVGVAINIYWPPSRWASFR